MFCIICCTLKKLSRIQSKLHLVILAFLIIAPLLQAQQNQMRSPEGKVDAKHRYPLENLLNPEGSLRLEEGLIGQLDPSGWQMVPDPYGEPRFFRVGQSITAPDAQLNSDQDINWDDRFGPLGLTRPRVGVIAVAGGDVYVGGGFAEAGGVAVSGIAKWDGTTWSDVGGGVTRTFNGTVFPGSVNALVISDNDIYVGGSFDTAGGVSVNNLAKWDGTIWSDVGSGVTSSSGFSSVGALAISGNDIYVGGVFDQAGGVSVDNLAKWDGSNWSDIGGGISDQDGFFNFTSIALLGDDIYVGGTFDLAGGTPVSGIAKWDGSQWSDLGGGVSTDGLKAHEGGIIRVDDIAISGNDVYVGGFFDAAGVISVTRFAKWDGTAWSAVGGDVQGQVTSIEIDGTDIYIGGFFGVAGGVAASFVAKWDGTNWSPLGSGVDEFASAVAVSGNNVYLGGAFFLAGGNPTGPIAKWDGSNWSGLGDGVRGGPLGFPWALATSGTDVYVVGRFTGAGGLRTRHIARWDGSNWSDVGGGVGGPNVTAVATGGSDVYVGGNFFDPFSTFARWDGSNWSDVGGGVNNFVWEITVNGTDVYVGGEFTQAGSIPVNNVAKWDGANWHDLGGGVNGTVRAIAVSGSDVYVGGSFTVADGLPVSNVARWDGSSWSDVGGGVNSGVKAIAAQGNEVYVGGSFTGAGGLPVSNVARWDGSSWSDVGGGVNSGVEAIAFNSNDVYVGGSFSEAGGTSAKSVAKWNGTCWSALGSGTNGFLQTLAIGSNSVYVGGFFSEAGGKPSIGFGRWEIPANLSPVANAGDDQTTLVNVAVTLDGSFSADPDGTIITYDWDFGDGNTDSGSQVNHTYTLPGVFTAALTVTDDGGLTCTDVAIITVQRVVDVTWCDSDLGNISGARDTVYICVGDVTGLDIISYQLVVTFDSNVLSAVGATSAGTLSAGFGPPTFSTGVPGQITVGGFGVQSLTGAGALVGLVFDVVGNTGETANVCLGNVFFNAGEPAVNIVDPCCPYCVGNPISANIADSLEGFSGQMVTIPITVGDLTSAGIISYQCVVEYDAAVLSAVGASSDGTISQDFGPPTANTSMPGQITVGGFGVNPLSGSGTLVNLFFDVIGSPGDMIDLTFQSMLFNAGCPSSDTNDGKFSIPNVFDISGTARYNITDGPVSGVLVNLSDADSSGVSASLDTTAASGAYVFENIQGGLNYTLTSSKEEDIGLFVISCFDAALTAQHAVGLITLTAEQQKAADVDEDDNIFTFDAALMCRYAVGFPPFGSTDKTGQWRLNPANRMYSPLSSDQVDQDFAATLLGDVDGNWTPAAGSGMALAKGEARRITFKEKPEGFGDGQQARTILRFDGSTPALAFELDLTYDAVLLRYKETFGIPESWKLVLNNDEAGRLRIGMFSTSALTEASEFLEVRWEVLKETERTEVRLERALVNAELQVPSYVSTELQNQIPEQFALHQNYPNPFNPETNIRYEIPEARDVRLTVYNLAGQQIRVLVDEKKEAGFQSVTWNGKDARGRQVASGVYLYRIQAGEFTDTRKLTLLR